MPGDDESMNDEAIWTTLPVSSRLFNLCCFVRYFSIEHRISCTLLQSCFHHNKNMFVKCVEGRKII